MIKYPETTHPHSKLTKQIIGVGIKVHKEIGPGFREKYYQRALTVYLKLTDCKVGLLLNFGQATLEIKRVKV